MNLLQFHDRFWNHSLQVIAQMCRRGVLLDRDYFHTQAEKALSRAAELNKRLQVYAHDFNRQFTEEINWASNVQVATFLYEFKCFPIPPFCGSGAAVKPNREKKPVTDEVGIRWLAKNHDSTLDLLLEMKKCEKLAQFMVKLPEMTNPDHRLRCHIGPGTDTGRLSSKNPNLQNIPSRNDPFAMRAGFVAPPGKKLIVADYSQLEMYVMAHFMLHKFSDSSLWDDIQSGDMHTATAFRVWGPDLHALGVTPANIKEVAKSYRDNAKTLNYAIAYGKTAAGLGSQITNAEGEAIGKEAAQGVLDAYFVAYPGLDRLFETFRREARLNGHATTLLGRTRPLMHIDSSNKWERFADERKAVNTVIQGSAADIVTAAMLRCAHEKWKCSDLTSLGCELILQVHDELVFEVPEEHATEAAGLVKQKMEHPFSAPLRVQLAADVEISDNWKEGK